MPDISPTKTRRCSPCGRTLPLTRQYFYQRRGGRFEPCCRECANKQRAADRKKRTGGDDLRCVASETHDKIRHAFRSLDPGGTEEAELRRRLAGVLKRFRGMPYETKVKGITWLMTEFLRPEEAKR